MSVKIAKKPSHHLFFMNIVVYSLQNLLKFHILIYQIYAKLDVYEIRWAVSSLNHNYVKNRLTEEKIKISNLNFY